MVEHDLGVEALGMLEEAFHQFGPLHAHHVGGPVVDLGGGHQLAALGHAGDQHWLQVGARGIDGGGVTGGAGTENDEAAVAGSLGHGDPRLWLIAKLYPPTAASFFGVPLEICELSL